MRDFRLQVYKKRKANNNSLNKWLYQNQDRYTADHRIFELIGREQKLISDAAKQHEIERLRQTIKGNGTIQDI